MESRKYSINKEGSLGLLALGDLGLISWRKARGDLKIVKPEDETNKPKEPKNKKK